MFLSFLIALPCRCKSRRASEHGPAEDAVVVNLLQALVVVPMDEIISPADAARLVKGDEYDSVL
jgi:hypothetical protein